MIIIELELIVYNLITD